MGATTAATAAVALLKRLEVPYRLHEYRHDPGEAYGEEAARRLGADPDRVLKTLVVSTGGSLSVAVIPVSCELDLKAVAAAFGDKRAALAEAKDAERATGYVVGGISPLAQRRRLATVVDLGATGWETVFVSGGRRGLEIELSPQHLVRLSNAAVAAISRPRHRPG